MAVDEITQGRHLTVGIPRINLLTKEKRILLKEFIFNRPNIPLTRLKYAHKRNLLVLFKNQNIRDLFVTELAQELQVYKCPTDKAKSRCICGIGFLYKKSVHKHRKNCAIYKRSQPVTEECVLIPKRKWSRKKTNPALNPKIKLED